MGVKLEKGYYGSNEQTLGAYAYRGFDVIVDNDMSVPNYGGSFTVGIYEMGGEDYSGIEVFTFEGFTLRKACLEVDVMINMILESRGILSRIVAEAMKTRECTCGAKHTSNPGFHADWCDKN